MNSHIKIKTAFSFFWIFLFPISLLKSQSKQDSIHRSILTYSVGAEYGTILTTNYFLRQIETPKKYTGLSFKLQKQTDGSQLWERMYGNPSYGIGFYVSDFIDDKHLGNPAAVFGTFESTAKRWKRLKWDYWINFGIAFNVHPYNEKTYPNPSLGSKMNMYIGVGNSIKYSLGDYFDLGVGAIFNHLSNGAMKMPNKGLNFVAPQVSLTYHPKFMNLYNSSELGDSKYDTFNTVEVAGLYGRKNVFYRGEERYYDLKSPYEGLNYSIYGIEAFYMRQYSYKSSIGLGIGFSYDEQYNHTMYVDNNEVVNRKRFKNDHFLLSIMPAYRLNIDRFSVNLALGYYPFKKRSQFDKDKLFQRIGLQYQITDRLFASFGINAFDLHRANYLEWKLGYVVAKKKRKE